MRTPRRAAPRALVPMVGLVLGLLAVLAMHGVSTHVSLLPQLGHAGAASSSHRDAGTHTGSHDGPDAGSDAGSHANSHAGAHAGALCALIVAGAVLLPPRPGGSRRGRLADAGRPTARAWSPDPPVPKLSFGAH